jgi:tetratricopeptide (TPR) repeat protein
VRFKEEGQRDKALERFSRAIELYPDYFQAMYERGDLYVTQRKLNEAAADFAHALKVDDHYGPALRGSGYCKLEKKEFAQAIDDFERSLSAEPDNANTYLLLGIANLELNRREPARQALQKALGFSAQPVPRAHIYLANLFALEHQYQQAADELRKYLDAEPTTADAAEMRKIEAQWRARAAVP